MGKGGVGKTTVAASVGSVFAELRQDDRVVAIDADTAFGKLGSRIDPKAAGFVLGAGGRPAPRHVRRRAQPRGQQLRRACSCWPAKSSTARRRVLDPAIYREATARLDRHFTISIVDCGSTMDSAGHPGGAARPRRVDRGVLAVGGRRVGGRPDDGVAGQPRLTGLLHRTVVVLNDSDGHADKRTRSILVAAVRQSRSGRRRGAVRRASASRRGDRRRPRRCRRRHAARSSRSPRRSPSTSRPPPTGRGTAGDDVSRNGTQSGRPHRDSA